VTQDDWLKVILSFLGGGVAASIPTHFFTLRRSRKTVVGVRAEVFPVLNPVMIEANSSARVSIEHEGVATSFDNLFMALVVLENQGPGDLEELHLAVEIGKGDATPPVALLLTAKGYDASHVALIEVPVSPTSPLSVSRVTLSPFNRDDRYEVRAFITKLSGADTDVTADDITLSAQEPVQFVRKDDALVSSVYEVANAALEIKFGPSTRMNLSARRKR
jgi:hypothetical protein